MCRIDYADDEALCLQPPVERKARKDHVCDDCGRIISKAETYTYGAWVFDDYVSSVKVCAHCVAAGRWLRVVCGGHLWPGIQEELIEHDEEEPDLRSRGLQWLIAASRQHWVRRGCLVPVAMVSAWVDKALSQLPAETKRYA